MNFPLDLPDFIVTSSAGGGAPAAFAYPLYLHNPAQVYGFRFAGSAGGISGSGVWASDTCLVIEAPDGTRYGVGGSSGLMESCGNKPWDFQGLGSTDDGVYESNHGWVLDPPVTAHEGIWTLTFSHDLASPSAAEIAWSEVTVTLLVIPPVLCAQPDWLNVAPQSGVTPAGESTPIAVTIDGADLAAGIHYVGLYLETDDPEQPLVVVPIRVSVNEGNAAIFSDRFQP